MTLSGTFSRLPALLPGRSLSCHHSALSL